MEKEELEKKLESLTQQVVELNKKVEKLTEKESAAELIPSTVEDLSTSPDVQQALRALGSELKGKEEGIAIGLGCLVRTKEGSLLWYEKSAMDKWLSCPESVVVHFLSPFSNEQRISLMKALFLGTKTATELKETTGLTDGQLYHHLKDLALAGYLLKEERNSYSLTTEGKMILSIVLGMANYFKDWPHEPQKVVEEIEEESE
jgi:DNA-binding HxlR family transcriptional regulator